MLYWFTLAACGAPADAVDLPVAYEQGSADQEPPAISTEAATTAVDAAFTTVFTYNADVMFRAYEEVMEYADEACPLVSSGEGGTMWDTNCTSTSGASYNGFVSAFEGVQGDVEGRRMRGEATIDLPDGTRMIVAGNASTDVFTSAWISEISGVMRYDGPASVGTWVEAEPDVNLAYELSEDGAGSVSGVVVEGSIAGLVGEVTAVAFTDFRVENNQSWPCSSEPSGVLLLRDAEGVWARLTFDVAGSAEAGWTIPEGSCDGCGSLTFDGDDLGQVCVDVGALFGAELPPW